MAKGDGTQHERARDRLLGREVPPQRINPTLLFMDETAFFRGEKRYAKASRYRTRTQISIHSF